MEHEETHGEARTAASNSHRRGAVVRVESRRRREAPPVNSRGREAVDPTSLITGERRRCGIAKSLHCQT